VTRASETTQSLIYFANFVQKKNAKLRKPKPAILIGKYDASVMLKWERPISHMR